MHFSYFLSLFLLPITLISAQNSAADNNYLGSTPTERRIINQAQALDVISAAAAQSANISVPVNIAVTDPSGFLVAFLRTDNAFLGSIDISQKKARTVALFNGAFTTQGFYNASQPGMSLYGMCCDDVRSNCSKSGSWCITWAIGSCFLCGMRMKLANRDVVV